jgi:hypothetical protein
LVNDGEWLPDNMIFGDIKPSIAEKKLIYIYIRVYIYIDSSFYRNVVDPIINHPIDQPLPATMGTTTIMAILTYGIYDIQNDLTVTSLELWLVCGIIPQNNIISAMFSVNELI